MWQAWILIFLLREWEGTNSTIQLGPSEQYSNILLLNHLHPWQRSRRQATYTALPRGLSQIPTHYHSELGLNWNTGSTSQHLKDPVMTLSDILLAVLVTIAKAGGEIHTLWIFTNSYVNMGHQKYTPPIFNCLKKMKTHAGLWMYTSTRTVWWNNTCFKNEIVSTYSGWPLCTIASSPDPTLTRGKMVWWTEIEFLGLARTCSCNSVT